MAGDASAKVISIRELLKKYPSLDSPADLDQLLALALHKNLEYIYKNPEKKLSRSQVQAFQKYLRLRKAHWPLAYLQGSQEFYGLKFLLNKNVLTPRPESEILVAEALKYLTPSKNQKVLEMGTGSGCIIVSVAKNAPENSYLASDISLPALKIAKTNARKHGLKNQIKFIKSDLFSKIHAAKFNLIMANLPYLNSKQMAEPSIKKEPAKALLAGADGLKYYAKFFQQVPNFLADKYQILIEIDPRQTDQIKEIVKNNLASAKIEIIKDLAGCDRMVKIKK